MSIKAAFFVEIGTVGLAGKRGLPTFAVSKDKKTLGRVSLFEISKEIDLEFVLGKKDPLLPRERRQLKITGSPLQPSATEGFFDVC